MRAVIACALLGEMSSRGLGSRNNKVQHKKVLLRAPRTSKSALARFPISGSLREGRYSFIIGSGAPKPGGEHEAPHSNKGVSSTSPVAIFCFQGALRQADSTPHTQDTFIMAIGGFERSIGCSYAGGVGEEYTWFHCTAGHLIKNQANKKDRLILTGT